MSLRPLNREDATAALEIWNRAATFDPISPPILEEKVWQDPDYDCDLTWGVEIGGQLVAFAVGVCRAGYEPAMGYVKLLAVEPKYQGQRVGSQLLKCVEAKLAKKGAKEIRVAESAPNYLTPGIDQRYSAAKSFFERHGYQPFAQSVNLNVDLLDAAFDTTQAEQQLANQGIDVRRANAADWPAVVAFLVAHWPTWEPETRRALANDPASLHLALQDRAVIGFAAYHGNNVGTGWFGPMGTALDRRKSGIGAVLLRRCLSDLKDQGYATSTIAWAAHLNFYKRHAGATVDRKFLRYRKMLSGQMSPTD